MESVIKQSVDKCFNWLELNMLSFDRGYWGIYERIRTDVNQRVGLCRPDTATECMRAIQMYKQKYSVERMGDVYENLVRWLQYAQNKNDEDKNTAFPFYLTDGWRDFPRGLQLYQNDNGKIIINLSILFKETGDERLLLMAKRSADWWISVQKEKGYYWDPLCIKNEAHADIPCMQLWMMTAMFALAWATGESKYKVSGYKALKCASKYILNNRIVTSWEKNKDEAWRTVASENYIALLCFALCYKYTMDEKFLDLIKQIEGFCDSLFDEKEGAILNFTTETKNASLNISEDLTDLVYTLGFAMNALAEMWLIFKDERYKQKAGKLATFLQSIQCNEKNSRVDGAWRGAYNLRLKKYDGRCNQNNEIDEGGEFSVYAGWCSLPIIFGMMKIDN